AAIAEVCDSGAFVHGPACKRLEHAVAKYCGAPRAVGCASGSDALLLALMALDIGPGDEVIIPSFTFFATAGAVARLGAKPVFADILPETFNIDPADVVAKRTRATKAVIPVHLFGQCADMEDLQTAAGGLPLIEDAAQAIGAGYRGRRAGSMGKFGCFSFYPTKNLGGFGDGGMITVQDDKLADKLVVMRDHGQHPRYHHHFVGVNSRLDTLQAAVLNVKLKRLDEFASRRAANAQRYLAEFERLGLGDHFTPPQISTLCDPVWNQFTVRVADGKRDELHRFLAERHIGAAVYYPIPLHLQECFASLGYEPGSLPETERAAQEVLSLPIYSELTRDEQDAVIGALAEFCGVGASRRTAAA
ncbi:MAG: DegT/DnrJ/EryC1/StrS family aminotransferase, partial [Planctomycetales bacterium]|nr:DegT/DnrJ/EryC1/StrS family aminotransferase [Planctomycetales bacterium]